MPALISFWLPIKYLCRASAVYAIMYNGHAIAEPVCLQDLESTSCFELTPPRSSFPGSLSSALEAARTDSAMISNSDLADIARWSVTPDVAAIDGSFPTPENLTASDWLKIQTFSDLMRGEIEVREQTESLTMDAAIAGITVPYISKDGYYLPSGLRPDRSPWEVPGWPPSATPVLPPNVPGTSPVDPAQFPAQPTELPLSGPSAPMAPLQLLAPIAPLQLSIFSGLGQASTAQLVEKLRQPSDYWRAIHDTVYISHGSEPLANVVGTVQSPLPTNHCTGYLLADRTTVVTAAHCLGLWGNSLANEHSAGGENGVDRNRPA